MHMTDGCSPCVLTSQCGLPTSPSIVARNSPWKTHCKMNLARPTQFRVTAARVAGTYSFFRFLPWVSGSCHMRCESRLLGDSRSLRFWVGLAKLIFLCVFYGEFLATTEGLVGRPHWLVRTQGGNPSDICIGREGSDSPLRYQKKHQNEKGPGSEA